MSRRPQSLGAPFLQLDEVLVPELLRLLAAAVALDGIHPVRAQVAQRGAQPEDELLDDALPRHQLALRAVEGVVERDGLLGRLAERGEAVVRPQQRLLAGYELRCDGDMREVVA